MPSTIVPIRMAVPPPLANSPLPTAPPSLYAPTTLPPTLAAGLSRRPIRIRPDGKCEACVCEICICGTHHCPPTPRHLQGREEKEQLTLTTQSRRTYSRPPLNSYPPRAGHPIGAIPSGGTWEGSSSYSSDFISHPYSSASPAKPLVSPPLFDTSQPLQSSTVSHTAYPRHPLPPPGLRGRPPSPFASAGAFIASSTYQETFPVHLIEPPTPFHPIHALSHCEEDRDFTTNASVNYRGLQAERRERMRPCHAMQGARTLGEGGDGPLPHSETASQYVHHHSARVQPILPTPAAYDDDDGDEREMRSEAMGQYGKKERIASYGIRPIAALTFSGEKLEGRSVTQDSYGEIDPAAYTPVQGKPEGKVEKEKEDRTWHTESSAHFQRKTPPPPNTLPQVRVGVAFDSTEGGGFDTESRARYLDHGDCQREIVAPVVPRGVEGVKFEGVSTMQDAYRGGMVGGRRELMRPVDALREKEGDDREWVSENRYHFQEKKVEGCPAGELEERGRKDRHGHLWYEKGVEEKKWRRMYTGVQRSSVVW